MTPTVDPISMAIDHILLLRDLVEKATANCKNKMRDKGDAIRRRAKDLPSMVYTVGLIPALTFYMSKIENSKLYTDLYKLLRNRDKKLGEQLAGNPSSDLCQEIGGKEAAGYTTLLALAAAALSEAGVANTDLSSLQNLAASLKSLREQGKEHYAARLLVEYLNEVKKLAEAFFAKG
ncbi:CRISPR type III-B/RAMP module-associated protein Cmr5 [Pyrodictium delaneyi]|uniref:CRISPR type III-B/RAMP module-associated protein Cmr5 n=1 Tax=Pyrodictium delaneyi TaxID=1273541 RepID=A0A0P0N3T4_9CREN|nr:type III-B CRISPR module-associated protein Cmr5 [Pyrodictium delaneyi]ALL01406.1 CRISPR type III-B/RAMP module-associated protein Cmr5 [Pyrodictium delaneyi]OWJ54495.1 type III-B CRISPR module-associated protein Cmr5 [Pyrodictium delaneyi]OWJ54675.1 type III-B CRISPR module-associated protein Cmr5 [Pyrodictium delaneyi]